MNKALISDFLHMIQALTIMVGTLGLAYMSTTLFSLRQASSKAHLYVIVSCLIAFILAASWLFFLTVYAEARIS